MPLACGAFSCVSADTLAKCGHPDDIMSVRTRFRSVQAQVRMARKKPRQAPAPAQWPVRHDISVLTLQMRRCRRAEAYHPGDLTDEKVQTGGGHIIRVTLQMKRCR